MTCKVFLQRETLSGAIEVLLSSRCHEAVGAAGRGNKRHDGTRRGKQVGGWEREGKGSRTGDRYTAFGQRAHPAEGHTDEASEKLADSSIPEAHLVRENAALPPWLPEAHDLRARGCGGQHVRQGTGDADSECPVRSTNRGTRRRSRRTCRMGGRDMPQKEGGQGEANWMLLAV